jgi:hypothetical protein
VAKVRPSRFVAPDGSSDSEGQVLRLELERQLSAVLAAQTERDQRIAQLNDELTLKSALLEQAEATKRAELEGRRHSDKLLAVQTSLVKQKNVKLADMRAKRNRDGRRRGLD